MKREWELNLQSVEFAIDGSTRVNWYFRGELGIDLSFKNSGPHFSSKPYFEACRTLKDPNHIRYMVEPLM